MRFDGTLEKWNDDRGFGFIKTANSSEQVFVHISAFARDGRLTVVWTGEEPTGGLDRWGIFGQRFTAAGTPLGGEFRAHANGQGMQLQGEVAVDRHGGFLVAWHEPEGGQDVWGRRFDPSGAPRGLEFRINSFTTAVQEGAAIAADRSGNFVVAWNSGDEALRGQDGDGFGVFGPPPATAKPIRADYRERATPEHPPGLYGPADGPLAVNTLASGDRLAPLDTSPLKATRGTYTNAEPQDLRGTLLSIALGLFLLDAIIVAILGGGLSALLRRRTATAVVALAFALSSIALPTKGLAQSPKQPAANAASDDFAIKAVGQTRLAYVVTGNADVDSIVKAGMSGLTLFLAQRTALEAGDPVGIDPARDELAFFPLIYWPVISGAPTPSKEAINKLDAYMKQGGTVLFDTRDAVEAPPGAGGESQTPGMMTLRNIIGSLDIPELEPVPREHVLTKTFYLLRDFPGRFTTGQTWVETLPRNEEDDGAERPARGGDGVSPIIITSNDLAGAWALRPDGQPMLPLTPGEPRQREWAFRAGVNIVMYTLTGNYKADQVHVPALLERLGQ